MSVINTVRGWFLSVVYAVERLYALASEHWAVVLAAVLAAVLAWVVLALRSTLADERAEAGRRHAGSGLRRPTSTLTPVVAHRAYAEPWRERLLEPEEFRGLIITDEQARQQAEALLRRYEPPLNAWMFGEH